FAFVGQILIDPITEWESAAGVTLSRSSIIGLIVINASGFALIIMGIVGLASKSRIATLNDQ
ncbi:MAG: hypothetical protein K2N56_03255, partial [Oscillospiraceae bacterium]|nr:hypothetical protein [Oscillospiraceae bacterium]